MLTFLWKYKQYVVFILLALAVLIYIGILKMNINNLKADIREKDAQIKELTIEKESYKVALKDCADTNINNDKVCKDQKKGLQEQFDKTIKEYEKRIKSIQETYEICCNATNTNDYKPNSVIDPENGKKILIQFNKEIDEWNRQLNK